MRLKAIKLAGFKSFVDPTTVPIASNMVCIVGPNGCGKSNTIDAVRWVMGESSAKNLRGASMSDVIFNGSSTRKPVGQATVELVFDNTDGRIGGECAAFSEISIKRKVSRDGQSNYYLNNTRCRRRDITDIFLGTGLGPRSYAIIEQGTVSRMIEAKPEELRVFIEEAAGISKYKERRRETENRMRHTRENLERISDLCDELGKRLASLQRQANTAERYKTLKQEERSLKAQLLALRFLHLDGLLQEQAKVIQAEEITLEAYKADLTGIAAAEENQREQKIELGDNFNEVQARHYALATEIARIEQSIQHAKDSYEQQTRELTEVERAWQEASSHSETDQQTIDELTMSVEMQQEQRLISEDATLESAAALTQAEETMQLWQSEWDTFNQQASEQVRKAEVERARVHHLEQNLEQSRHRLTKMEQELASLSVGALDQEIDQFALQREELSEQLDQLRQQAQQQREQINDARELGQSLGRELDAERSQLQSMQGRKASLEALQQQALGQDQGEVNQWLQQKGLDNALRLAQTMTVEPDWAHAVEVVLGLHLESVCIEGFSDINTALSELNQGNLTLFDTSAQIPSNTHHDSAERLLNKVQTEHSLAALLGHIYVADNVADALVIQGQLQVHESVISRDGVWLGSDWLRVSHGVDEKAGVLAREQALKTLTLQVEESEACIDERQQSLDEGRSDLHELEHGREELQSNLNQTTQLLARAESQLSARQERLQQYHTRKQRLEQDITEQHQQRESDKKQIMQARVLLDNSLQLTEDHELRRSDLSQRREEYRAQLDEWRINARNQRENAHEIALKLNSSRTQLEGTQNRLARMESQLSHLSRRREELQLSLQKGNDPITEMAAQLEEILQNRLAVEEALSLARRGVEEIDHSLRDLTEKRHQLENKAQTIRSALEKLRMGAQEFKVRSQTVKEQFAETTFDLDETFRGLPEDASEANWQDKINDISQKIQRLGAINLAAIDEYKEQSERKGYLDTQHKDLTDALTTLENAIRKIDKETRTRFKDTFDKVDSGLKELFPRLFGGGHAYLEMTGDDLLDTGVTIMAQPPGKRNSSIYLLSGGEKALTAVALVFSIFQLNPAPFCMLDEVDAPLDEANVGRFCEMVKLMSAKVQFIFITHNKTTMEMGDHLTGVTMSEPGVSRLVAVDIAEATQLVSA